MPVPIDETLFRLVSIGALAGTLILSLVIVTRFGDRDVFEPLHERFVFGLPWGTLVVLLGVYLVFYLVQGGGRDGGPIITAFRSWSFWYPEGVLFSSFAHASNSHLTSNLLGTVAFAPIVEYAWGHYPPEENDGNVDDSGGMRHQLFATPPGRIALFVAGVFAVGLLDSLFVPGAVIGFSGVVFAFAGFALVVRPLLTVLAMLGIRAVRLVRNALLDPWLTATAEPQFISPSWADVALQGHLFGLLVGVALAVGLLRLREQRVNLTYIWFAALVFAVTRSMYAIYWYLGTDRFVLYLALGTAGVFALASLIALAALPTDRRLLARRNRGPEIRDVALGLLLVTILTVAVAGVAYNTVSVSPGDDIAGGIDAGDYTVTYVTDVEDQYISAVEVPFVGEALSVNVSGVVVVSDDRNIWELSRSSNRLAFDGGAAIPVGGSTWRETVYIDRTEWAFLDGNTTYKVYGQHVDRDRKLLYTDDPAVADARLAGSTVSIEPTEEFYDIVVEQNGSVVGTRTVPAHNETVSIGGITFERVEDDLFAIYEQTEIRLAEFRREGQ